MRILKIAVSTVIAFFIVILLWHVFSDNNGLKELSGWLLWLVTCLPIAIGLYLLGLGISKSFKRRKFDLKIIYGALLVFVGWYYFFPYMIYSFGHF